VIFLSIFVSVGFDVPPPPQATNPKETKATYVPFLKKFIIVPYQDK
jgi:hypothetical protein